VARDPRRSLKLTTNAANEAAALKLPEYFVLEMVRKSAPFRGTGLNRRYEEYGFRVGDESIHEVVRLARTLTGIELTRALWLSLKQAHEYGTDSPMWRSEAEELMLAAEVALGLREEC